MRDLAIGQQAAHVFQPQLDDLDQLFLAQRAEDDDVVDAVQELRPEMPVQSVCITCSLAFSKSSGVRRFSACR